MPAYIANLYAGNVFQIFAMISGHAVEPYELLLSVNGKCGEMEFSKTIKTIIQKTEADINFPLHRLAAKVQIKALQDTEDSETQSNKETIKNNILLLSLSLNLGSRYSSFVGVDPARKIQFLLVRSSSRMNLD
jgi:hypothetical protein